MYSSSPQVSHTLLEGIHFALSNATETTSQLDALFTVTSGFLRCALGSFAERASVPAHQQIESVPVNT